jgi:hypothetical protein
MLTPENKEIQMALAADLIIMANQEGFFEKQKSLFPQIKSVLKGRGFTSAKNILAKPMKALTEVSKKWFPRILPKALEILVQVCHCPRKLKEMLCKHM